MGFNDDKITFFSRAVRDDSYVMPSQHIHKEHELYFLEKGMSKYFIDSDIFVLEEGDIIFVPKGHFHKAEYYKEKPSERLLIMFDDEFLGEEYLEYLKPLNENKLVKLPSDKLYRIKEIFAKIQHENRHKTKGYVELQRLYLRELIILISRYRTSEINSQLPNSYRIIQDAVRFINENYASDITLSSTAAKYALSRSYFSRLFKEATGFGFSEYLNIIRVTAAEKMLLLDNPSITEVAAACGFNDSNYFAAVFKNIKGITPKKFSILNK